MDGPLVKWVQVVDQRNNIFKALVSEADEIKADRSIIAYKKQAKRKISTKLTEDQKNTNSATIIVKKELIILYFRQKLPKPIIQN